MKRSILICMLIPALAACASTRPVSPPIAEVRSAFEAPVRVAVDADYVLGPTDVVSISTFGEPDLSFDEILIDGSGNLSFPLVGKVKADGSTAQELAERIEQALAARYLRNPDVMVQLKEANSHSAVVEGAVLRPGVFGVSRQTTLLALLALANGPTEIASLDDIIIFRTVNGERMGALFNLNHIRRGIMDDPQIIPGDTVVVNYSNGRRLYQDLLKSTPLIAAVFRSLSN